MERMAEEIEQRRVDVDADEEMSGGEEELGRYEDEETDLEFLPNRTPVETYDTFVVSMRSRGNATYYEHRLTKVPKSMAWSYRKNIFGHSHEIVRAIELPCTPVVGFNYPNGAPQHYYLYALHMTGSLPYQVKGTPLVVMNMRKEISVR